MASSWDVVVAGAGPAGSRAAELFAARGARVLLLDPMAPWEKPCGGGLTAAALRNTPELHELDSMTHPVTEILAVAPGGASVVVPLRTQYRVVSRVTLSRWGLERAQRAGARFVSAGVQSAERGGGGWKIADTAGVVHTGRWLVAADGATSRLRKVLAPGLKPELAPTRVAYPQNGSPPGRAIFFFLPAAQGYIWDFPRPDHHSVGIGVAPGTFRRDALDGALAQYRVAEAGEIHAADQAGAGAVIATSHWLSGRFADLGGPDYALLGDAAGLADPATGEGIDYALRSAALAVASFGERRGFAAYPEAARQSLQREMERAMLVRKWLYRPAVADRLIRGARRSPRLALALMSLADAINEHGSLRAALWRAAFSSAPDRDAALAGCGCPEGNGGACAPNARGNRTPPLALGGAAP